MLADVVAVIGKSLVYSNLIMFSEMASIKYLHHHHLHLTLVFHSCIEKLDAVMYWVAHSLSNQQAGS